MRVCVCERVCVVERVGGGLSNGLPGGEEAGTAHWLCFRPQETPGDGAPLNQSWPGSASLTWEDVAAVASAAPPSALSAALANHVLTRSFGMRAAAVDEGGRSTHPDVSPVKFGIYVAPTASLHPLRLNVFDTGNRTWEGDIV